MGKKKYSDAQVLWLEYNASAKVWKSRSEFMDAFKETFNLDITRSQFTNLLCYYDIKPMTKQTESLFTEKQKMWLIENAQSGLFKTCKELTKVYNALFKQNRNHENMYSYLHQWGVSLDTGYNRGKYDNEMDEWLIKNFDKYTQYEELAKKFNQKFKTQKTAAALAHRCTRSLGLKRQIHRFKKGEPSVNAKQVGTISYRKGEPWVKVNDNNDKSAWKPLRKVIYEKHSGKVPDGYCVVSLDGDKSNVDKDNLYLMDRRGTVIMAKNGWWTGNKVLTANGCRWCNLYCTAKDNGVF